MTFIDLVRDATCPDADRHWLQPCWGGAVAAGMLWLAFDRYQQLKHHNEFSAFFAPIGLSLSSLAISVAIGSAVGAVGGWAERRWRRRHAEAARKVARRVGFKLFPDAATLKHLSRKFRLLKHWKRSDWLMAGEKDGVSVNVFDVTTACWDIDGESRLHSTVAVLPATGVPEFLIAPRGRLLPGKWSGIRLDSDQQKSDRDAEAVEAFSRQFVVYRNYSAQADDLCPPPREFSPEDELRSFLTPDLMNSLLPFSDCYIELREENLAITRGRGFRPPAEREQLIDDAISIRSILTKTERSADTQT